MIGAIYCRYDRKYVKTYYPMDGSIQCPISWFFDYEDRERYHTLFYSEITRINLIHLHLSVKGLERDSKEDFYFWYVIVYETNLELITEIHDHSLYVCRTCIVFETCKSFVFCFVLFTTYDRAHFTACPRQHSVS